MMVIIISFFCVWKNCSGEKWHISLKIQERLILKKNNKNDFLMQIEIFIDLNDCLFVFKD